MKIGPGSQSGVWVVSKGGVGGGPSLVGDLGRGGVPLRLVVRVSGTPDWHRTME